MKLYYFAGACPLASHIVLAWAGKPCESVVVSRQDVKKPEFLALNPMGAVPVLVDGELALTQNAAILEYIAEQAPEAKLVGNTAQERAETRRWLGLVNSDLHPKFGLIFGAHSYFTDEADQNKLKAAAIPKADAIIAVLDKQLAGKNWLTGTRSIADAYLYVVLRWATAIKMDLSAYSNIQRFIQHMQADAGVQAALKVEGLDTI